MTIQDLEKDLQKKESQNFGREHNKTVYDVWNAKEDSDTVQKGDFDGEKDRMIERKKKAAMIGGAVILGILVLMLIVAAVTFFQKGFFSQDRVAITLNSPSTINSNTVTEILFEYVNNNRSNLYNSKIVVNFGDYFMPIEDQEGLVMVSKNKAVIDIGDIVGGEHDKVSVAGYFAGPANSSNTIHGSLRYSPEKTEAVYEASGNTTTTIASSPISVDVDLPLEIVSGNLVDTSIIVKNDSNSDISNLKVTIETGEGFNIHKTTPIATNASTWLINNLNANDEYVINIQGTLDANVGTSQPFVVEVGTQEGENKYIVYATDRQAPKIIESPIVIKQEVIDNADGVAFAGEKLQYSVHFRNNSKKPLRDAIIAVNFDTNMLDFANLELFEKGDYNSEKREIIWKAADVPELKTLNPNDYGVVKFSIPVLENFPIETVNDKNFSIVTLSTIDSRDIPSELRANKTVLSNVLALPIGAKVIFNSDKEYISGEENPTVDKKTTYKIKFSIDNINNSIADAVVKAVLPTHVQFEKGDEDIEFNDRTNEIVWNSGNIQNGAGIIREGVETEFIVSIIPSIEQLGQEMILIKEQILNAVDGFTDIQITESGSVVTTQYLDGNNNQGIVIE